MRIATHMATIIIALFFTTNSYNMDAPTSSIMDDLHEMRLELGTIVGAFLSSTISEIIIGEELRAIAQNPYKAQKAQVRTGNGICDGEKEYLSKRIPIVKATLESLLNQKLEDDHIPNITFVMSGGGYRALLCTLGSLRGAENTGLLNCATHLTTLSGSTWAVAPWISTGMSLKKFEKYIIKCVSKPFTELSSAEELLIFETAAVKNFCGQPKTLVDLYGDLLGNRLLIALGNNRHLSYLSDQAQKIHDGSYPYPIYTVIDADETIATNQTWYGLTPHEIENFTDNLHIPSWACGRTFKRGESTNNAPAINIAKVMGACGSAFGANLHTIEGELIKRLGHHELLEELMTTMLKPIEAERPINFYAKIANYTYKMNPTEKGPHYKTFVDAGTDFNLPVPPVSSQCPERKADILIICDASAGKMGKELKKTAQYMIKHNLPFPHINYDNIDKKTISIFKDNNNPKIPTVIYLPRISDQESIKTHTTKSGFEKYKILENFNLDNETNNGFAQTIHFQYEPHNARKVISQTEFNMMINKQLIIEAIRQKVEQKLQTK